MPSKRQVILWGASGHASVVADILRLRDEFVIAGFLDDVSPGRKGEIYCGAPILGGSDLLPRLLAKNCKHIIIAIGDCAARLKCARIAAKCGFSFASAVHPAAVIAADVKIGQGTVVMAGVVVNPGSSIGSHVILNTASSVDHHGDIADGVHISPGARLAGGVAVGRGSWIGMGALVKEQVRVGGDCIVGAASLVRINVPDATTVWGVPATTKRRNNSK